MKCLYQKKCAPQSSYPKSAPPSKTIPLPKLRATHLLIKVHAIALKLTDWIVIVSKDAASPSSLVGCDYAGTVIHPIHRVGGEEEFQRGRQSLRHHTRSEPQSGLRWCRGGVCCSHWQCLRCMFWRGRIGKIYLRLGYVVSRVDKASLRIHLRA